jgi:hypothetical protein
MICLELIEIEGDRELGKGARTRRAGSSRGSANE